MYWILQYVIRVGLLVRRTNKKIKLLSQEPNLEVRHKCDLGMFSTDQCILQYRGFLFAPNFHKHNNSTTQWSNFLSLAFVVFSIAILLCSGIGKTAPLALPWFCPHLCVRSKDFWLCVHIFEAQLKFLIWLSAVGVDCRSSSTVHCLGPVRTVTTGLLTLLPWFVSDLATSESTLGFAFTFLKLS